jgi:autophagy-related protein 17
VSYQTAFNKLILELARRSQYREAAENIVRGMMSQLEAMTEGTSHRLRACVFIVNTSFVASAEENQVRSHFNSEYGAHLPEDICLCVGNAPTRWEVVPWSGDALEFLPIIDSDLIAQVRCRIGQVLPGIEVDTVVQAKDRIHAELEKAPGGLGAESL